MPQRREQIIGSTSSDMHPSFWKMLLEGVEMELGAVNREFEEGDAVGVPAVLTKLRALMASCMAGAVMRDCTQRLRSIESCSAAYIGEQG